MSDTQRKRLKSAWPVVRVMLGLGLLAGVFALPALLAPDTAAPAIKLPIEALWAVVALGLARPRAVFETIRGVVAVWALLVGVLCAADVGVRTAFARVFDPVRDLGLVADGWRMLSGTLGVWPAASLLAGVLIAALAWLCAMLWGLGGIARLGHARTRFTLSIAGLGALCLVIAALPGARDLAPGFRSSASGYISARVAGIETALADRRAFERALPRDALAGIPADALLSRLAGVRVMVVFVESYGRSALDDPRYQDSTRKRLQRIEASLRAAGLSARSGWLDSPVVGGQSWLAHATLLSGLWVDNQNRYDRLIDSDRASLNRLFKHAGWSTVAAMPAITLAWPEAAWFGYDQVLAAADLGYRGEAFNWVTMPDQYTLSATERLTAAMPAPLMIETALISSHAPWTPIPEMVPWEAVGDGTIFTPQARRGDPPEVVWRDAERVRTQYRGAIDYSLAAVGSFMARHGDNTLFIVLGDHQPAPLITGAQASQAVPIHFVADDPELLSNLRSWPLTAGLIPGPHAPVVPMDEFRADFVRAMSAPLPEMPAND
ncbi:sulfatase-like hydrolase/transferase [Salinisphaera dokdonensis]